MAITIDPTLPADSESPRQGASRIRNIVLNLLSLVGQGGGGAVTFTSNPFNIDTSGNVTVPTTINVPAPTVGTSATTKTYVDTSNSSILAAAETFTTNAIANVPTPTSGPNAANKSYVDTSDTSTLTTAENFTTSSIANVPTPTSGANAANKTYVDSSDTTTLTTAENFTNTQIAAIVFPTVPAPTVSTTLVNTSISASSSATILQVTSTPPATPTSSQKYRALVSATVFFELGTNGVNGNLLGYISDNQSLFTNRVATQVVLSIGASAQFTPALFLTRISDVTWTNASGAVTFTLTGVTGTLNTYTIASASGLDANSKSLLSVTWVPAS